MDIKEMQKIIIKHIKKNIIEDDFERTDPDDYFDWKSFKSFIKGNKKIVKSIDDIEELKFIIQLIKRIENRGFENMDKESMASFPTDGLCFTKDKKIVFFNER